MRPDGQNRLDDGAQAVWHLLAPEQGVVATIDVPTDLRRGDRIDAGGATWRVCETLGTVAHVERIAPEAEVSLRVSASSETVARALAHRLECNARPVATAHGWVVLVDAGSGASRTAALTQVAAAARSVVAEHPDAELFVLDGTRPVRVPPRM